MQCLSLYSRLISLNKMFSRLNHVVKNDRIPSLSVNGLLLCVYMHACKHHVIFIYCRIILVLLLTFWGISTPLSIMAVPRHKSTSSLQRFSLDLYQHLHCLFSFILNMVLYSVGWSWTCYVAKALLNSRFFCFHLPNTGIKLCITKLGFFCLFYDHPNRYEVMIWYLTAVSILSPWWLVISSIFSCNYWSHWFSTSHTYRHLYFKTDLKVQAK